MPRKSESAGILRRGSACLSCRRRKLKCDGHRPVCNQCTTMRRGQECQYDDSARKSRTQSLREKLMALEAKLRELEYQPGSSKHPTAIDLNGSPSSSSSLSGTPPSGFNAFGELEQAQFNLDPADFGQWLETSTVWDMNGVESSVFSSASFPTAFSFNQTFDSPPSSSPSHSDPSASPPDLSGTFFNPGTGTFDFAGAVYSIAGGAAPDPSWIDEQASALPHQVRTALIRSFILHRHQCCHYTDSSRLDVSFVGSQASPSLACAVLLLGHFFTPKGTFTSGLEHQLLEETLHAVSTSIHSQDRLTDVVQALGLLAQYFFFNNRNTEGNRHLMAAKRMALELGMQKVAHPDLSLFPFDLQNPFTSATKSMTAGAILGVNEPVNAGGQQCDWWDQALVFWQIFLVDSVWSAGNGFATASSDFDGQCQNITTPLPVFEHDLEATVKNSPISSLFAADPHAFQASSLSTMSFKVMAACVYRRSHRFYGSPSENGVSWSYQHSVELALQRLIDIVPGFAGKEARYQQRPTFDTELYAVHVLILGSTIQLHVDNGLNLKVSLAAKRLVELISLLDDEDYSYLDPSLSVCWATVIKAFGRMLENLNAPSTSASASNAMYSVVFLRRCIDVLLAAIQKMSICCKPLTSRLLKAFKVTSGSSSIGPHGGIQHPSYAYSSPHQLPVTAQ